MESGSWYEHDQMWPIAEQVCENKRSELYAQICNTAGVAEMERGHLKSAKSLLQSVRDMREEMLPENHVDLADIYSTYGNLVMTGMKSKDDLNEVERLFDGALEIDRLNGKEHCDSIMHIRIGNNGVLYNLQGRHEKAIEYIELGRDYAIKLFGKNSHFDAT
jgi:tetratricopeptide (TPR) repeat protein